MYPTYAGDNQLWKLGPDGTLVSKTGLVADIKDKKVAVGPTVSAGFQTVVQIKSGAIKSTMNGLVMDIAEGNTKVSAYV